MILKNILIFSLVLISTSGFSQELNCKISIANNLEVSSTDVDLEVFKDMENNITEFMNNTRWTKDVFEIEERINCNLLITIENKSGNDGYSGQIQIQSTRPVYGTSYNTTLFNHADKNFDITYLRNQTLLFSIDQYRSNLTSILAYYAYMILGYDYDSFSLEGGTEQFNKAQKIAITAGNITGWDPNQKGNRDNRYYVVNNALNSLFKPLRTAYYNYHRLAFDQMSTNIQDARKIVIAALNGLDRINRSRPSSINMDIFFNTKANEIVSLFQEADIRQKNQLLAILKKLNPVNTSKYEKIL